MTTKPKKSKAMERLDAIVGQPLTVGSHLKTVRLGDGLTQTEFAETLAVSKQHLSDIENGRKVVSVERAAAWAKKLGYSEKLFVKLALQDVVDRAGLEYEVAI